MNYQEAIAVRKRQIAGQPVDRHELAEANRRIAHDREMASTFGFDRPQSTPPARFGQRNAAPPVAFPEPRQPAVILHPSTGKPVRCISVDEWQRTLRAFDSYKPERRV